MQSTQNIKIQYKDIIQLILNSQLPWKQGWKQSISAVHNQLSQLIYKQTNASKMQQLMASDLIHIFDDSNIKVFVIYFSDSVTKITSNIVNNEIQSLIQPIQNVDRDFAYLGFKVLYDKPILIHYLQKTPILIAFNNYNDTQGVSNSIKNNNKQLYWMMKAHSNKNYIIQVQPMYNSLQIQLSFVDGLWHFFIPKQYNSCQMQCFNQQVVYNIDQEYTIELDSYQTMVYNEIQRLLSTLNLSFKTLDIQCIYTFNVQSQLLSNFPVKHEQIQITDIYKLPTGKDQLITNSQSIMSYSETCDSINQLELKHFMSFMNNPQIQHILVNVYHKGSLAIYQTFQLTTQLLLFQELYQQHINMIKVPDSIGALNNMLQLYEQDSNNPKKYQKLKYNISGQFTRFLREQLDQQEKTHEEWKHILRQQLQGFKSQQLKDILHKLNVKQVNKTKLQLIDEVSEILGSNDTFQIGRQIRYVQLIQRFFTDQEK